MASCWCHWIGGWPLTCSCPECSLAKQCARGQSGDDALAPSPLIAPFHIINFPLACRTLAIVAAAQMMGCPLAAARLMNGGKDDGLSLECCLLVGVDNGLSRCCF
jgi:hypothetical protein